jgi:signal recognition particle subunit SRP54
VIRVSRDFTLDDFIAQFRQVGKLGSIGKVMGMIPGMSASTKQMNLGEHDVERQVKQMQSIYNSMTVEERREPDVLDVNRRHRISRGAGVRITAVGEFIRKYEISRDLMRDVASMAFRDRARLLIAIVAEDRHKRDPSYAHSMARGSWSVAAFLVVLSVAVIWLLVRSS